MFTAMKYMALWGGAVALSLGAPLHPVARLPLSQRFASERREGRAGRILSFLGAR